jgi:hypothetical protein
MSEVAPPPPLPLMQIPKRSNPVAKGMKCSIGDEMFNRLEKSLICAPPKHLEEFDHKAPPSCTKYKIPEPSLLIPWVQYNSNSCSPLSPFCLFNGLKDLRLEVNWHPLNHHARDGWMMVCGQEFSVVFLSHS